MPDRRILAIDAGTTGINVALYDHEAKVVSQADSDFTQHYPRPGWVEHDPEEIWTVTLRLVQEIGSGVPPGRLAGLGITNQRETAVLWDRRSGRPVSNAIVWQCRRSQPQCERLRQAGHASRLVDKTGLVPDAYFSATKIQWMLENLPGVRARAEAGELAFGTIDTWLVWKLTGGRLHVTDPTNASRTLLFNIEEKRWDDELLRLMEIPRALLPEVRPSAGIFGEADAAILGKPVPISGIAGDQQAALVGQGGVLPGSAKNTYGTGCFFLINTGTKRVRSRSGLLSTLACDRIGSAVLALEGSVFIAGAAVQWLRDQMGFIRQSAETESLAASVPDTGGVYLVPAFVGLGAPYWDMEARGGLLGITRGTNRAHVVRAALESIAYQTRDLVEAAERDLGYRIEELRVDGGAAANDFLMQFQADLLGIPVDRPANLETTALGAGFLAGLGCGFWTRWEEVARHRRTERRFLPRMSADQREGLYRGWKNAVSRVRSQG
ncbi:MAG: glycerol kinase GlpK [Planctomycetes bacterium]|nr:glycerol kinase GlpK [Planctomycetota bacterium]